MSCSCYETCTIREEYCRKELRIFEWLDCLSYQFAVVPTSKKKLRRTLHSNWYDYHSSCTCAHRRTCLWMYLCYWRLLRKHKASLHHFVGFYGSPNICQYLLSLAPYLISLELHLCQPCYCCSSTSSSLVPDRIEHSMCKNNDNPKKFYFDRRTLLRASSTWLKNSDWSVVLSFFPTYFTHGREVKMVMIGSRHAAEPLLFVRLFHWIYLWKSLLSNLHQILHPARKQTDISSWRRRLARMSNQDRP